MGFEQDKRRAIAVGEFEQSGPIELMHQQFFRTPPRAVIYLIAHLRRDRKPSFGHLANLFCRRTVAKSDASNIAAAITLAQVLEGEFLRHGKTSPERHWAAYARGSSSLSDETCSTPQSSIAQYPGWGGVPSIEREGRSLLSMRPTRLTKSGEKAPVPCPNSAQQTGTGPHQTTPNGTVEILKLL